MENSVYKAIEAHMRSCMEDSAHDAQHIYRVLALALDLAEHQAGGVDLDVLTAAALLHDIGRPDQAGDPAVCHAAAGSRKAYAFLLDLGWDERKAAHVRDCVLTHRYRTDRRPVTVEAKLLFDADKLDVTGAVGIARTLIYAGQVGQPLYSTGPDGEILDGSEEAPPSFLHEYRHKLANIGETLYTERARALARERAPAADAFYRALLAEITLNGEPATL